MKKNREVICAFAAWVLSACFFMSCFMIPGLAEKINSLGNSNMLVYGMSLILFCLLFVAGMGIAHRHEVAGKTFPENVKARKTAFWLMLFIQIPFWLLCISGETEQLGSVAAKYGWHTQPAMIAAFLFLAELAIFFWACQNVCFPEKDGEWIIRLVYAALVLLVFYSMYTPNIFGRGELSDAYHGHAYFNSVYNIYQGMPYTHNVTSIYGHYGLFFKIPMELVHGDFKAFVAMVAGIGAFAHICAFLILELLVKSRVLRVLGALAVTFPVLGMRGGFYWQVWPHRVIFPMLLFLYGAWILKKELCNFWTAVGGYLICLLAILWNTETGLILTVAWAGMLISRFLSVGKIKLRRLLWLIFAQFAGMAGAVFGAYGTVNLYNILKHSPANSFEDFLIPLLSGSYMTGVLHLDMPTEPNAYMAVITLFLTGTALGMTSWFSGKERHCWQKEFLFLLSVGSLGCLVYYINRPAYHNLDCITMPAAIMAAYWGQKGIEFIKNEEWKRFDSLSLRHVTVSGVGLICIVAVLAMATGTVLQFAQNSKIKENYHNVQEFEDFAEQIAAVVPENTPSFGINVPEICSMLHRRTECFTMDFSDMLVRPDSLKELKDQLEHAEVPGAFTGKSSMNIWKRNDPETYRWFMDHYELKETIPFYGEKFLYYIKK